MKKLLVLSVAFVFMAGMVSCKKCMECKAEGVSSSQLAEVKQEVCGSKKERSDFEASFKTTYSALGYNDVKCD